MISKVGYTIIQNGIERDIQIESVLYFFRKKYNYKSKHILFEDEKQIGVITVKKDHWIYSGNTSFSKEELTDLFDFITSYESAFNKIILPSFGFGIELDNNITYCEVLFRDGPYDIWFDGKIAARIDQDDNCRWVQLMGATLRKKVIKVITDRIEAHFSR